MDPEDQTPPEQQGAGAVEAPRPTGRYLYRREGASGVEMVVLDPRDPSDAATLAQLHREGRDLALTPLDTASEEGLRTEFDIQERQRRLQSDLGTGGQVALGVGLGLARAGTIGTFDAGLDEESRRNIAAMERNVPAAPIAGEVIGELGAATLTGGLGLSRAGVRLATLGGLAQATSNTVEMLARRRFARMGMARGSRRFLAGVAGDVAGGAVEAGVYEAANIAVTGDPLDAEGLLSQGAIVAAFGLGTRGLGALAGAGMRRMRGRIPPAGEIAEGARAEARALSDAGLSPGYGPNGEFVDLQPGFVTSTNAREASIPRPLERVMGGFGGVADEPAAVRLRRTLGAVQDEFPISEEHRTALSHRAAEQMQGVLDVANGTGARSVVDASERHRLIREALGAFGDEDGVVMGNSLAARLDSLEQSIGSGSGASFDTARSVIRRLREAALGAVSPEVTALREEILRARAAVLRQGVGQRSAAESLRIRGLEERLRSLESRPRGAAADVAIRIDRTLDELSQEGVLAGSRRTSANDPAVSATQQAMDLATRAVGDSGLPVDRTLADGIASRQALLQDFRLGNDFERLYTTSGERGRRVVEAGSFQRAFDNDSLRAAGRESSQTQAENYLRTVDAMVAEQSRLAPSPELDALREKIREASSNLVELRRASQIAGGMRSGSSVESKQAQFIAGTGLGSTGAIVGGLVGGPAGAAVGAGLGFGIGALTHPYSAMRVYSSVRYALRGSETRAGRATAALREAVRPPSPSSPPRARRIGAAARALPRTVARLLAADTRDDEYTAVSDQLRELSSNPEAMLQRLESLTSAMGEEIPELAGSISQVLVRQAQYLADSLPPEPGDGGMFEGLRRSSVLPGDARDLARRLHMAADPWAALELASQGALTPVHAEAFRAMWPELYTATAQLVAGIIADLDDIPPFAVRDQLSMLLGDTSDPVLDPAFILRMQRPRAQTQAQSRALPRSASSIGISRSFSGGGRTVTQSIQRELVR